MSDIKFSDINNKNQKYKLSDIIIYAPKSHLPASNAKSMGKYRFFKSDSSDIQYFSDFELVKGLYIIMNDGGLCDFKIFNGTFAYSDHCICFKSKENTKYLYQLLLAFKNKINNEGFIGGGLKNIDRKYFNSLEIHLPNLSEQQKIADMLCYIDKEIEKNKLKIKKLKDLKYSLLNKMFPKENSNIPELRFKGFTETWEQRKLKDIANKVIEKNNNFQYTETFTNSAEFGIINQQDFFSRDIAQINNLNTYYIVKKGDFVYNPRISILAPVGPINCNRLNRVGVMSPLYTIFRVHNMNIVYLEYFFKSKHWHSFMNLNGDTGARFDRFSIKDSIFFEMPIPIPYLKEQQKIGELFSKIDSLITLHQYMYNKLFQVKNDTFTHYSTYYSNILHNFLPFNFTYAFSQYKQYSLFLCFKIPYTIPYNYTYKNNKNFTFLH